MRLQRRARIVSNFLRPLALSVFLLSIPSILWAAPSTAAPATDVETEGPGSTPEDAEGDSAQDSTIFSATITVTASREERDSFDEPATVESVGYDDITTRKKVGNLVDTFGEMAAVSVQKTAQGQGSPFIRGFTGFQNLLLIDGVRFNNSILRSGPNQSWATIDPLTSSRIETVKGPGSVLYGSDAVGATVNVISRQLPVTDEPFVTGEVSSRWAEAEDAALLRAEVMGSTRGGLSYLVGGSIKDYGDFRAGSEIGTVEGSAYDEHGVDAKLQYQPTDDSELTLLFQSFSQNQVPRTETTLLSKSWRGTVPGRELRRDHDQDRSLGYLRYSKSGLGPRIDAAEITFAYQNTDESRIRVRDSGRSDLSGLSVDTWSGQVQLKSQSRWGRFTYGVEFAHDSVDSFRTDFNADGSVRGVRIQGAVADDASYDLLGIFAQDEITLADRRLTLIFGGRFSSQRLDAGRVEDPETGEEISLDGDWSAVVGSVRALWRPDPDGSDRWRLFASVAQAFRAPNLSDVTSLDATSAVETPTPGLEPEKYLGLEAGIKHRSSRSALTASVFHTLIDDQIVQSPTGRFIDGTPEVQKDNVGDGFVQGVEVSASFRPRRTIELWGNVSWMEGQVDQFLFTDDGQGVEVREPVSRLVPWMSHWGVRYHSRSRSWWLELHGTAFSKADKLALRDVTDRRRIPPGGTPGFTAVGLRGAVELKGGQLTLAAGIENLFDEDYRIHGSGQNMPGRNLVVSVRFRG